MNNNNVIEYKEMCFDSNLNVFRNADNGEVINNPSYPLGERRISAGFIVK